MKLVLVAAVLVALAGCGDEGSVTAASTLSGRTFLSEAVTERGADRPLVTGTRIRLTFGNDGGITATAGCNILGGEVEVLDDQLIIGDLSSTEMGCDPPRHDQDTWLAGVLAADPAYTLADDRLAIQTGSTNIELLDRRIADPDRPLEGTVWQLDGTIDGEAASSTPGGVTATLRVSGGQLTVEIEACTSDDTSVEVQTSALVVEPLTLRHSGCSPDAATVADAIATVLEGTVDYQIEASSLTVTNPSGDGLTLRAAE